MSVREPLELADGEGLERVLLWARHRKARGRYVVERLVGDAGRGVERVELVELLLQQGGEVVQDGFSPHRLERRPDG